MLVTDIAISRHTYCPVRRVHTADVSLTFKNRVVRLFCTLTGMGEADESQCVTGLVGDALRQMGRMPEYRAGKDRIQMTPNLCDAMAVYPGWDESFGHALVDAPAQKPKDAMPGQRRAVA